MPRGPSSPTPTTRRPRTASAARAEHDPSADIRARCHCTTPTPLLTIPKTGDNYSLGLLLAIAGISLRAGRFLVHKSARRKILRPVTMMTGTPRTKNVGK